VIAINNASRRVPFHALCLYDRMTAEYLDTLEDHHHLIISAGPLRTLLTVDEPSARVSELVNYFCRRIAGRTFMHEPRIGGSTIEELLRHLDHHNGIKEAELYGFTFIGRYGNQIRGMKSLNESMKLYDCCPSSGQCIGIEKRIPPWVTNRNMP